MPDGCDDAISNRLSVGPPSASSRQLSATVRTSSMPSEVVTWPVTVSASMSRTCLPRRIWSAEARFVAMVVLPTPPLGLKTAMMVARRAPAPSAPAPWRTGPLPSSTVWRGCTWPRPASGSIGGVGPGEVLVVDPLAVGFAGEAVEGPRRDDHECREPRDPLRAARPRRPSDRSSSVSPSRTAGPMSLRESSTFSSARGWSTGMTRKPASSSSAADGRRFVRGKSDDDRWSGQGGSPTASGDQSPASGSWAATSSWPGAWA